MYTALTQLLIAHLAIGCLFVIGKWMLIILYMKMVPKSERKILPAYQLETVITMDFILWPVNLIPKAKKMKA